MEFKETKNHYLHPDFEDMEVNNEKKPSPLALLLQTCKNVGSIKDNKDFCGFNQACSPNSTINRLRKLSKRCRSNCSSNSSLTDREYLSPMRKHKTGKKKKCEIVETKNADTSSETSYHSSSSLLNNLLQFVKNTSNAQLSGNDKMELLNFLAGQFNDKEKVTDLSKPNTNSENKCNHFNVEKGYHLETPVESKSVSFLNYGLGRCSSHDEEVTNPLHNSLETLDLSKSTSAIKYCMYCGKLIPLLPMLLAHIRLEHGNSSFSEQNLQSPSNMYDMFPAINPYLPSDATKANETFSFLTDYLSSSFQGLNNLIC